MERDDATAPLNIRLTTASARQGLRWRRFSRDALQFQRLERLARGFDFVTKGEPLAVDHRAQMRLQVWPPPAPPRAFAFQQRRARGKLQPHSALCATTDFTSHPVPPYIRIARFFKLFYTHLVRLSWYALASLVLCHWLIAYAVMRWFETGEITELVAFWYFYATTATTVGYGDVSPKTSGGRLLTTLWIMPGGIVLFTAFIARFIQFMSDHWRKRMRGAADYSFLANHIVILGWQGRPTQRIIEEIIGDVSAERREIVLCTTKEIENPLPDVVKFVRDVSLTALPLHRRAGVAQAAIVIALGHDDNDTLAAALAAAAINRTAHLVAYFEQPAFADLLTAHCPRAEATVSLSMEMLVRAAQDPGSSRVHQDLLSVARGQTQFSLRVPDDAHGLRYGTLLSSLKERHDATMVAVADDMFGTGLLVNAPTAQPVAAGSVVYYIAEKRIASGALRWMAQQ